MPPDIVIRASGIWDTRAPFHIFLNEHRAINRTYHLTTVSLRYLQDLARSNPGRSGRNFFQIRNSSMEKCKAWRGFELSYPLDERGKRRIPEMSGIAEELKAAIYNLRRASISSYVSLFETYFHCWVLNYLLAKLENGTSWTSDEREVAKLMSPVHTSDHTPGWPRILRMLPEIKDGLRRLPHISNNPETGEEVVEPVDEMLNAYQTMLFWREFRNLVVHSGGIVSGAFFSRHHEFFKHLRRPYISYMPDMELGRTVSLYDDVFRATATVHYNAALWLNDFLEQFSNYRRGHPFAPQKKPKHFHFSKRHVPEKLLLEGDHELSFERAINPK